MQQYTTIIKKFGKQGEKTGWTYVDVPAAVAEKMKPGHKQSFRIKGKLDAVTIKQAAILPMGNGDFILPLKADIRKLLGKTKGMELKVAVEEDTSPILLNQDLLECLAEEPNALEFFNTLTPGHQKYFSNWINSAKTDVTKAKRIALAVNAMAKKMDFGQMLRDAKEQKRALEG
jgi:hypothetical protein